MAIEAYAVEDKGTLMVDSVRETAVDAKVAALKLVKIQGLRWSAMERSGFRVVRVSVQAVAVAKAKPARRYLDNPRDMTPEARYRLRQPAEAAAYVRREQRDQEEP